jgi:hypothetical protein
MNDEVDKSDAIGRYIDDLVNSQFESSSEEIHSCPVCGGELKIQATKYRRGIYQLLGIMVSWKICDVTMAVDYGVDDK